MKSSSGAAAFDVLMFQSVLGSFDEIGGEITCVCDARWVPGWLRKPSVTTRQELSEIVRHNKQAGLTKKHNQSIFGDDQGRAERNVFGNREQNTRARNDACGCEHAANRAEASEPLGKAARAKSTAEAANRRYEALSQSQMRRGRNHTFVNTIHPAPEIHEH